MRPGPLSTSEHQRLPETLGGYPRSAPALAEMKVGDLVRPRPLTSSEYQRTRETLEGAHAFNGIGLGRVCSRADEPTSTTPRAPWCRTTLRKPNSTPQCRKAVYCRGGGDELYLAPNLSELRRDF